MAEEGNMVRAVRTVRTRPLPRAEGGGAPRLRPPDGTGPDGRLRQRGAHIGIGGVRRDGAGRAVRGVVVGVSGPGRGKRGAGIRISGPGRGADMRISRPGRGRRGAGERDGKCRSGCRGRAAEQCQDREEQRGEEVPHVVRRWAVRPPRGRVPRGAPGRGLTSAGPGARTPRPRRRRPGRSPKSARHPARRRSRGRERRAPAHPGSSRSGR